MNTRGSTVIRTARFFICLILALNVGALSASAARSNWKLDLSRVVIIGDSLLAGFQNSSLMDSLQTNGIAAVIARQARFDLALPLIAPPGMPNVMVLQDPGPPPIIVRSGGMSPGRLDPTTQTMNLAVPGHFVGDALTTRPDLPFDSLTDMVLGLPGLLGGVSRSQVEWAEALAPTTIIVWIGNMDVLGAAIDGDASLATPVDQFENAYTNLLNRLAATGARLVVANVPDVTVIPFVMPLQVAAPFFGVPVEVLAAALGLAPTDYITVDAIPAIAAILQGMALPPLAPENVLDGAEIATLAARVSSFNAIIAKSVASHDGILVDTHEYLDHLVQSPPVIGGRRVTTQFLGGIFSLDGVHPGNTGNALTANFFIKTMNRKGAAGIPPVSVRQVAKHDPLLPPEN